MRKAHQALFSRVKILPECRTLHRMFMELMGWLCIAFPPMQELHDPNCQEASSSPQYHYNSDSIVTHSIMPHTCTRDSARLTESKRHRAEETANRQNYCRWKVQFSGEDWKHKSLWLKPYSLWLWCPHDWDVSQQGTLVELSKNESTDPPRSEHYIQSCLTRITYVDYSPDADMDANCNMQAVYRHNSKCGFG